MDPAQEPIPFGEISQQSADAEVPCESVDANNIADQVQTEMMKRASVYKSLSNGLIALGVFATFIGVLVGLVCLKFQLAPWDIAWIRETGLSPEVYSILDRSRFEVTALGLIALNFLLFFLRSERLNSEASMAEYNSYEPLEQWNLTDDVTTAFADDPLSEMESSLLGDDLNREIYDQEHSKVDVTCPEAEIQEIGALRSNNADAQLKIATDELSRVRRELVTCRQQLETANQAKSQFLANMSHELRTPMNGIMGMTDLLLGGNLTAREDRFVHSIASSSNTLLAIINDLLDFSKIESGILQLEHARFSVRDCVEDVCASLAATAHSKNIELICYVDENVTAQMDGDPSRVRQILNNLISNAIAFTHEGEVVVRVARKSDTNGKSTYQCDVQDTGEGITPELQIALFEAFTQADPSNTRGHGGLGMGLAIAKQLVSMMDGEITFRSRLGEGTRFSFTMQLEDVAESGVVSRRRSLHGAHVLVVDDNETNRTILFHQLSNWGLVVETVEGGTQALKALRDAHDRGVGFDVLILDLHMPEMDGIQLARAIQTEDDFKHIQAIMLTSAILQLDGMELRKLGIYKYVSKPARQSVLHDSLASLMPSANQGVPAIPKPHYFAPTVNARVLLVEDNPVNQDVAMGMLEQLGCHVALATDGKDAVEMGETEKYDIVLMDCQMPTMDGYEATRLIKTNGSLNSPTPIVALTANAMDGDREKCLSAGMDDYVSKPVQTQVLSHMLEKWVGRVPMEEFDPSAHSQTPALLASGVRDDDLGNSSVGLDLDVGVDDELEGSIEISSTLMAPEPATVEPVAAERVAPEPTAPEPAAPIYVKPDGDQATPTKDMLEQNVFASDLCEGTDEDEDSFKEQSNSVINVKAINIIRGLQRPGKADLLTKVVGIYFSKTPEVLEQMSTALQEKDYSAISACAHSLKSSSAYLGVDSLSIKCRLIESAINDEKFSDLDTLVAGVVEDYELASIELDALLQQKAA